MSQAESNPVARSYLFVPGNRADRFEKACAAGADAVIVDLEDAVPPDDKEAARAALAAWLSPARSVLVRINGADTRWFDDDLALCRLPGVAGIVLPKAGAPGELLELHDAGAKEIYPLIETAHGFENARVLAEAPGVRRLMFGSIDFKLDLGIEGDDDALLYFRSQLVLASRLASAQPPVDGVSTAIDDAGELERDTLRARRLGFGGKLCIHPKQVAAVNRCFSPSAADIAWAKRILDASAASGGAAVAVDGKMVDRPVILRARQIADEAARRHPADRMHPGT
ncbi:CoA ester lyase [Noviherbaspirillum sp. UKPF54]|nr:CoA ester lyase [Noviherbaspirillum sp. UKPF54]QDZ30419.1 CoA ester lyase [Noviherbaspirillum sp. UKPF54]